MELRVPHVTSYARAPSSLLFLWSARYPKMPRFFHFLREFWPMPHPLMIHSALALFAFGFVLVRVRVQRLLQKVI